MTKQLIEMKVNGDALEVLVAPEDLLLNVLRNQLGLTGAKYGCGLGRCGSCIVLMDGEPVNSCLILAVAAEGKEITTIEGLWREQGPHPIQEAFIAHGAMQCGFCTPGMVLSSKALLNRNPHPDETEVREALESNLCRCTGYAKIVEAVMSLSHAGKGE